MKSLNEIYNTFTKESYPPNEKNISEVPFEHIQEFLFTNFGNLSGFSQKVSLVGQITTPKGPESYVVVEISLPLEGGGSILISGASQGNIGIAGLITGAVKNAILRHAGAGAELYTHVEGQEPQFDNSPPGAPANPFKPQPQQFIPAAAPQTYGAKQYPEWNGELIIRTGQYATLKWSQLPNEAIMSMCARGNDLAKKELARRQIAA